MVNGNAKGKRGEREFAKALTNILGVTARRGQQFSGSPDSPDVVTSLEDVHFEVKRTETLSLYKAMDQATADAGKQTPVVAHRRNKREWLIVVSLTDLERLAQAIVNRKDTQQ